jgi:hypothetical protein
MHSAVAPDTGAKILGSAPGRVHLRISDGRQSGVCRSSPAFRSPHRHTSPRCAGRERRPRGCDPDSARAPTRRPGLVATLLAPQLRMKARRRVEVDQRPVTVNLHPVNGLGVLHGAAVGHPEPVNMHRIGYTRRILDERIRRYHQHDHRLQRRRVVQRGEPLDPARVTSAVRGHRAVTPVLGGSPGDHVDAVQPVVAVGIEHALRVAASAHIDPAGAVPRVDERIGPDGLPVVTASIRSSHDHHRRRQLFRQH